jgi:hypothetical protein
MPGTRLCRAWTQPDTRNHVGETAIVCGKVVGADVLKNTIRGHGFPVSFDLDQPEPNPVFYFVAFGAQPDEAVAAYQGKRGGTWPTEANLPH